MLDRKYTHTARVWQPGSLWVFLVASIIFLGSSLESEASPGGLSLIGGFPDFFFVTTLGLNTGVTPIHNQLNAIYGLEASALAVYIDGPQWALPWGGFFMDGVYDQGRNVGRFSIGPQVGFFFFGLDAGFVTEAGAQVAFGADARAFLIAPIPVENEGDRALIKIKLYARTGTLFDSNETRSFNEYGLSVQYGFID